MKNEINKGSPENEVHLVYFGVESNFSFFLEKSR